MKSNLKRRLHAAASLAATTVVLSIAAPAWAQEEQSGTNGGLTEIVVTAQKRQQNQQDVPISMTALPESVLKANRITSVTDLGMAVPNLASRPVAAGSKLPAFTLRGVTSYGVVPGSDHEMSTYIDGVYIASTVGSSLDLPEVAQIEVLRGPQGTLFGRNATVGAISVSTRNPSDHFGFSQEFTAGNYHQFRSKTSLDTGQFGDFSALISFVHDQRRGDIENLGAGTVWKFPASAGVPTTQTSPKYLGDKNLNAVFAAIKYQPSADLRIVNKFDWSQDDYTAAGAAPVGVFPDALGPFGGFLSAVLGTQAKPVTYVTDGKRPKTVNNNFTLPSVGRNWGDSLTIDYRASDRLSFKNIVAYRESYLRSNNQIDGLGGLYVTQALANLIPSFQPVVGSPFVVLGISQVTTSKQWSEEFQVNYNSDLLTATAGFLYFNLKTESGGATGLPNNITLSVIPGGLIDGSISGAPSRSFNSATSVAGYLQAELHVARNVDIIGGVRVTHDNKSGTFVGSLGNIPFTYSDTEPSFLVGLNYKPSSDVLLYAKYSTAFVSGGAAGPISFLPEKAKSWEAGIKSDWFDHRLRANLALFDVKYTDLQTAQAGITLGHPELGLAIADLGDQHARGFEFESTAVPVDHLTLGFAAGYTWTKYTRLNPIIQVLGVPINTSNFFPTLQPDWNVNLSAQYDTAPLIANSPLTMRIDASWHSRQRLDSYTVLSAIPAYSSLTYGPATWLVNARIAFDKLELPFGKASIAFWVKNLTDADEITFPDILGGFVGSTEFQPARTFGVDVGFKF